MNVQDVPVLPRENTGQAHRRRDVCAAVLELGRAGRHVVPGDLRQLQAVVAVRPKAKSGAPATVPARPQLQRNRPNHPGRSADRSEPQDHVPPGQ